MGFDFAVVGGGLLGTATTYRLAARGARVVLLERDQLNAHASGQNAGSLHFQLEFRMVEHGDELAEQFARHLPLVLEAQRAWGLLGEELGADLEVAQDGGVMCAETDEQLRVLERKHALEARWGLETELLDAEAVRRVAPYLADTTRAVAFCPGEGHANPRLVGPAFARAAEAHGAELRVGADVVGLDRAGSRWRVALACGDAVDAEAVIVAAGVWTGRVTALADVRLPMIPVGLSMLATEATGAFVPHLVQHVGVRLSLKQAHDGNVLIGGGWAAKLRDDFAARPAVRLDALAGNAEAAMRVVPAVGRLSIIRTWSGIAPVTSDQMPLLGEVRRRPGLFVCAGGPGFTLGPVYARILSELVLDGSSELALPDYSPHRFAHLNVV